MSHHKVAPWLRLPLAVPHLLACWLVLPMMTLLILAGCASDQVSLDNPVPITSDQYSRVYQATVDVLAYEGYRLDRQDYRFGVITTYPRVSPTLFEPWNDQNSTAEQAVSSTINYQRRRVSIQLIPDTRQNSSPASTQPATQPADTAPASDGYLLEAQVLIEQVETPRRFLSGSAVPGRMFEDLRVAPTDLAQRQIKDNYWRVIGRDTRLEERLISAIVHKSGELAHAPRQVETDLPSQE